MSVEVKDGHGSRDGIVESPDAREKQRVIAADHDGNPFIPYAVRDGLRTSAKGRPKVVGDDINVSAILHEIR
jgi:hypothetical protein